METLKNKIMERKELAALLWAYRKDENLKKIEVQKAGRLARMLTVEGLENFMLPNEAQHVGVHGVGVGFCITFIIEIPVKNGL